MIVEVLTLWGAAELYQRWVRRPVKPKGKEWTFILRGRNRAPVTVVADSFELAVKELTKQKIDYKDIKSWTPDPDTAGTTRT